MQTRAGAKRKPRCFVLTVAMIGVSVLCSGYPAIASQSPLHTPPTLQSPVSAYPPPSSDGPLLFVGESGRPETAIFNAQNQQIGSIAAPTASVAFDRQGDYYVAPVGTSSALFIFQPPYKQKPQLISFGQTQLTWGVAVDTLTGVFAVSLAYGGGGPGPGYVEFFKHGATSPCAIVKANGGQLGPGSAFDREGRLFLDDPLNDGSSAIASISGECSARSIEVDTLPSPGIQPRNPFTFNSDDNLVFQDNNSEQVLTFAHPKNGKVAAPITTTILNLPDTRWRTGVFLDCLTADAQHLWAIPLTNYEKQLLLFRYPQGGTPIAAINVPNGYSCAVTPPLIP
jgi:hypothetical protein